MSKRLWRGPVKVPGARHQRDNTIGISCRTGLQAPEPGTRLRSLSAILAEDGHRA
jgi:hypothetical protein